MQQNVVILAIQFPNNIHRGKRKDHVGLSKAAVLVRTARCKSLPRSSVVRHWTKDLNIQRVRRNCKTAKELGSILQFVSHVYKHTRFCFE